MGSWLRRLGHGKGQGVRRMEPVRIVAVDLQGLEGKWIAIREGKVIAAKDSSDAIFMWLRSRQIRDASVLRVPAENEPELVGLG